MMHFRSRALLPALLFGVSSLFANVAFAQTAANLHGQVLGADGRPLPNAVIRVVSDQASHPGKAWRYTMVADALGKFSQEGLAPGAYLVMLFADGRGTNILRSVQLKAGDEREVDLTLAPTVHLAGTFSTDESHRSQAQRR